jgi:hypothetical protein
LKLRRDTIATEFPESNYQAAIFVCIATIGREDWSFGNGLAQLTDFSQKP